MGIGSKLIAGEFKQVGENEIRADRVAKLWDSRFRLTKWHQEFTLTVYRKGLKSRLFKSKITKASAKEIIDALDLIEIRDQTFINASGFVRKSP